MLGEISGPLGALWQPDLILAIQRVFGPGWRLVFEALSLLGGAQITVVAVAWARWFRGRELASRLLLALFLGIAVDLLLWNLWPTPRPDDPRIRVASKIPISSFPSGHLVTVLTLWGTLAAVRVLSWVVVVALALLVGLSRLALGAHYPGDILGGVIVGALLLGVVAWLWPRLRRASARWSWPGTAIAGSLVAVAALAAATLAPPARWSLLGLLAGVIVALPVEARLVDFAPDRTQTGAAWWRRRGAMLAVGAAGFAALALGGTPFREVPIVANLVVPTLVALWLMLGAPATFHRLGWSRDPGHR